MFLSQSRYSFFLSLVGKHMLTLCWECWEQLCGTCLALCLRRHSKDGHRCHSEMGNQPKGNLCSYTTQLLIFLWFPLPLWRYVGLTACCFSPHSLPQQKLEERGERNLEMEKHHPHAMGRKRPSIPSWVSSVCIMWIFTFFIHPLKKTHLSPQKF